MKIGIALGLLALISCVEFKIKEIADLDNYKIKDEFVQNLKELSFIKKKEEEAQNEEIDGVCKMLTYFIVDSRKRGLIELLEGEELRVNTANDFIDELYETCLNHIKEEDIQKIYSSIMEREFDLSNHQGFIFAKMDEY